MYIYSKLILLIVCIGSLCTESIHAQTYTPSPTPLTGHYPGGHVGLRGADTPEPGVSPFYFNRTFVPGTLKNSDGNTIAHVDKIVNGNIFGVAWNTKWKFLGMTYGGLLGIPVSDAYSRATSENYSSSSGFGLGDIVIAPLGLFGTSKHFDYQVGAGVWFGSGYFSPGSDKNHGSGFTGMIYSIGGIYYPDGNHKSFNISAIARIEQNFKQRITDIKPGNDVVIDWGIGSPFIPLDKAVKHILMGGVSGFITTQFSRESGVNAALNTDRYHVYAMGPELNYIYKPARLKFIIRTQWEFAAKNTTQGATYWIAVMYKFKKKDS